jgi:O-antigen/teichoic acid export membrane protein
LFFKKYKIFNISGSKVKRSVVFEFFGYGTQQILRLISNIILARILFPEAFGLATTVSIIIYGLTLLSDMGIQQFIIQSPHGDEVRYLNTAFTIHAVRGFVLTVLMVVLAYPASWFFKTPQLVPLVFMGSIQLLAIGFRSTSVFTLRRKLTIGWLTCLELGQNILTLVIMIPWAILSPSVFPLVAGGTISMCIYSVVSHLIPVGYRNRFLWDKEVFAKMNRFGRWILGSSSITFFAVQIDRIFYGRFIGMAWLGVYSIAFNLSEAFSALLSRLIVGILYPVLSQTNRDHIAEMSAVYYKIRLRFDTFFMTCLGILAGASDWLIKSLWDVRYVNAIWILKILCIKVLFICSIGIGETCLTSMGYTQYGFWRSTSRLVSVIIGLPLGWYFWGIPGMLWASVISELPSAYFIWKKLKQLKILRVYREILPIIIFVIAFGISFIIFYWIPVFHLHF